jgi:hypothetical protein
MSGKEFEKFDDAMKTILRADPKTVREAMEREKQENAQKRKAKNDNRDKDNTSIKRP